ncbi:hypothetical protein dqs_1702 [Azoarcus olearius]|uniref:DUF4124 domain-containing protein n=1 Tax=Azoarcus sp. (strain BH72) TaxID=418699 RepID=UPI000806213E|nr:DUF4124 domain-containing protein [Azoarcus olearius]ANQ84746.1 hypothetical protein dqs_1702 [Azoarcus olearius]
MPRALVLSALVVALSSALPVLGEIYSWRDKDGKVHYSDQAPPSGDVKVLRGGVQRPRSAAPTPAEEDGASAAANGATQSGANGEAKPAAEAKSAENRPKTAAEQEQAFRQRRAEAAEAQAKAEKENAVKADRERLCQEARNQLAALQSGQRMVRYGKDGERVVLDDAMRAEEAARTQRHVDEACR